MRSPVQRDSHSNSGDGKLQSYVGVICFLVSMAIIGWVWPGLPDWAPATLGVLIGYVCWLAYRAYRWWLQRTRRQPVD